MKLKRMWPGLCILVVFIIFDVIMVASSSFFSGLFPSGNMTLTYSCILTGLGVLIMSILTFLLGRICDHIGLKELADTIGVRVIYVLMLIAIFIGGVFYRLDVLSRTTFSPAGKLSLYENAQIGSAIPGNEYDLLSIVYSYMLRAILYFTGNKLVIAYYFQIALFMLFVLLGTIVCRLLLGKAAAVVFAAYVSFMPIFTLNLQKAMIGTDELFLVLFGFELLIISIYLKGISDGKYKSFGWILWYLIVGVVVGFMTYLDAGTIIAVLPLLLSVMFMAGDEKHTGILSFIFVVLSGVATFFGMIAQEGGIDQFTAVLQKWGQYYFHNLNIFSVFWTYTGYKIVYLVTFIAMSGVLVGFFRNRNFGRVSPWLLSTILVFIATPFFGATRMNDQNVVTVFFAFVLACVVSLITLTRQEEVFDRADEEAVEGAEAESEENAEGSENSDKTPAVNPMSTGTTVITPDEGYARKSYDDVPEKTLERGKKEETTVEEKKAEVVSETVTEVKETKPEPEKATVEVSKPATEEKEPAPEKPRFVPEGMVLPTGSEDEMDVDTSRMKMPQFKGKISLDRKEKAAKKEYVPQKKSKKKDDFDIPFKAGDDFDLK